MKNERYIVLEAKQPQKHRTNADPLVIYFVFDRVDDTWADCADNKVKWYSEADAAVAYERAAALNALDQQLLKTDSVDGVFCCQLAAICLMSDRLIEHMPNCSTLLHSQRLQQTQ